MTLDEDYWSKRYEQGSTGWDIGHEGPLAKIIDTLEDKNTSILIPGCGMAYEAEYAWKKGFKNVFVLDYSPIPLENFKKRFSEFPANQLIQADFFKHHAAYDVILEQTFFCALWPNLRADYVKHMHKLLTKDGLLTGVLFDFSLESGPPFGGSSEEYKSLFSRKFELEKLETCKFSIKPRLGKELYFKFRKK